MNGEISFNNFITFAAIRTNRCASLELILTATTEEVSFSSPRVLKAVVTFITSFFIGVLNQVSLILVHGITALEAVYLSF
jgi:hypothetical protein